MSSEPTPSLVSNRVRAWAALLLPPAAWFIYEVGLAAALRLSCTAVGNGLGLSWGVASLLICALAAALARSLIRPLAQPADQSRSTPWFARVSMLGAGAFALAIAFQTVATLIVPSCAH